MFQGLEHTAIASPDPPKLAQWYVDHLGFLVNHVYDGNYFVRAKNGTLIEIIPAIGTMAPQTAANFKNPGIRHMAISVDDFDAAHDALMKRGVTMLGEPFNNQGNRLVFFTDGDGNILHLIKREKPLP